MAASQITARFRGRDYIVLDAPACVLENLKCTACQQLLSEPVSTVCRHFFCEDCVSDLSSCPMGCKERFTFSPGIGAAEQLINSLTVKCPNSTQGCDWQGQLRDAQEHLAHRAADGLSLQLRREDDVYTEATLRTMTESTAQTEPSSVLTVAIMGCTRR